MSDQAPEIQIKPARTSIWERASIVWIIPFAALLISLVLAWQNYSSRGPLIEITFNDASGVQEGETEVKYRDVTIGRVAKVGFTDDLSKVIVTVRLKDDVARFADGDAQFWIVSPEVTTRGVTGLETVLSGVFIEATWDNQPDGIRYFFEGDDKAPLIRPGQEGVQIALRTTAGEGLSDGTPILYKGIEVGRISNSRIASDGISSIADAFIEAPYNDLINTSTRFWDTSGFTFSIGADGADVDFQSLASLLSGGITFDTIISGGEMVEDETIFRLYQDENLARASVFADPDSDALLQLSVVFDDNASGLIVGAPVELNGVSIGEVTGITGLVDPDTFGDTRVRLLATMALRSSKMGLGDQISVSETLDFLEDRVSAGLRARLASANIFTGGLKVELALLNAPAPASIDRGGIPFPVFPTTGSDIADVAATAEGVFERINNLPIEEVLQSAISALDAGTTLLAGDDLNAVPGEILGLVGDARGVIGSDEVQALPAQIGETATALTSAVTDVQSILSQLEEQDAVNRIVFAVEAVGQAATSADESLQRLPDLISQVDALVATANDLPLEELITEGSRLIQTTNNYFALEGVQALPNELKLALAEINTLVSGINAEDGSAKLVTAIEQAGQAASQVQDATSDLPALIDNLTQLSERVRDMPVDQVIDEVNTFLSAATRLIDTPDARELPAELNDALAELTTIMGELRDGGVIENANTTLAAASDAAKSVQTAADELPALVSRLNRVLAQAETTLSGLDEDSTLNYEARTALRDIQAAADAVTSLARAIERRPNSLLTGR